MLRAMRMVLYQPEIPPNTGNVARLCAATRTSLHLVEPLGFSLDDKHLRRAGLDYWPHVDVRVWPDWQAFLDSLLPGERLVATSARQGAPFHTASYTPHDCLLLGPETRGLPPEIVERAALAVRIPIWGQVRSLNLSTAAGVLLYAALGATGALDGR
jgi:tRNA (cytidine/uridine-2'-O-)-methyltransferase